MEAPLKAVRGMLLNPDEGLILAFHFNPASVRHTKATNYDIEVTPGYNAPLITWTAGGVRQIKFDLTFDATQGAVDSNIITFADPVVGVKGPMAVLEMFMRPRVAFIDVISDRESFTAPPECFLILGLRFWKTVIKSAPMEEVLHDARLTPQRLLASLTFIVKEEGRIAEINEIAERSIALGESTIGTKNTMLSVF